VNSSPANTSRRGLYAVYLTAVIGICSCAAGLRLTVPEEISGYVSNGFMLPVFRYGLLCMLIACGVVLTSARDFLGLFASLAIFTSTLWLAIQLAEPVVLFYEPLAELITTHPVLIPTMGITTGGTLLLPLRARRWFNPFVSTICGLAVGLFITLESPGTYDSDWFSSASALGCMTVVIASTAMSDIARRFFDDSWLRVAGRIFGSWLIAASLMLGAITIVPERSLESELMSTESPDGNDLTQQPNVQRIFNATNLPPAQERQVGDVMNTPNGETFIWTGQGWDSVK